MDIFNRCRVKREDDGYRVNLYIDNNTTEFADEFNHLKDERFTKLYGSVQNYIDDRFSNIKVKIVRVFLGTVPVAEILPGHKSEESLGQYDASILYHGEHFHEEDSFWSIAQKFEP